jgi:hypothetical protein
MNFLQITLLISILLYIVHIYLMIFSRDVISDFIENKNSHTTFEKEIKTQVSIQDNLIKHNFVNSSYIFSYLDKDSIFIKNKSRYNCIIKSFLINNKSIEINNTEIKHFSIEKLFILENNLENNLEIKIYIKCDNSK